MKRDESDYWSLREGDLPLPEDIGDEPLLANLVNNAIYRIRLFDFHRHLPTRSARARILLILLGAISIAVYMEPRLFPPLFIFFGCPLFLLRVFIWFPGPPSSSPGARQTTQAEAFGLSKALISDLPVTTINASDYFASKWGATLISPSAFRARRFYEIGILVICVGCVIVSLFPWPAMAPFPAAMGLACYYRSILRFTPHCTLGEVGLSIKFSEEEPLRTVFQNISWVVASVAITVGLMIAVMLGGFGIYALLESVLQAGSVSPVLWWISWQLALLGSGLLGWSLGTARGRRLRRKAPEIIQSGIEILDRFSELKRAQLDEKRPSYP